MTTVRETIPEALQPEVDAALAWFNSERAAAFEVTGIIDPDESLAANEPRDLRLVLCGGDLCEQRNFRVWREAEGFTVALQEEAAPEPGHATARPAELDPPPPGRDAPGSTPHWPSTRSWSSSSTAASGDRLVASSCEAT